MKGGWSLLMMQRVKPSLTQPPEPWKPFGLRVDGSLSTFLGFLLFENKCF